MDDLAPCARCPHCSSDKRQTKAGRTKYRSARFHCVACDKDYTPRPKQPGYDAPTRRQALALVLEGLSLRATARTVGVNPQTVANWLAAHQADLEQQGQSSLPPAPVAAQTVELDEVQVFIGARKKKTLGLHRYSHRPADALHGGLGCGRGTHL